MFAEENTNQTEESRVPGNVDSPLAGVSGHLGEEDRPQSGVGHGHTGQGTDVGTPETLHPQGRDGQHAQGHRQPNVQTQVRPLVSLVEEPGLCPHRDLAGARGLALVYCGSGVCPGQHWGLSRHTAVTSQCSAR